MYQKHLLHLFKAAGWKNPQAGTVWIRRRKLLWANVRRRRGVVVCWRRCLSRKVGMKDINSTVYRLRRYTRRWRKLWHKLRYLSHRKCGKILFNLIPTSASSKKCQDVLKNSSISSLKKADLHRLHRKRKGFWLRLAALSRMWANWVFRTRRGEKITDWLGRGCGRRRMRRGSQRFTSWCWWKKCDKLIFISFLHNI